MAWRRHSGFGAPVGNPGSITVYMLYVLRGLAVYGRIIPKAMDQVMCQEGITFVLGSAKGSCDYNWYNHLNIYSKNRLIE